MGFRHTFRVRCDTQVGEVVAVTGSCKQLGEWSKQRVVLMTRESIESNVWFVESFLDAEQNSFRYCVVVILPPAVPLNKNHIIVRRWETHLLPREIKKLNNCSVDTFGILDEKKRIQRGWLTDEMIIQLKIQGDGITIFKNKFTESKLWAKVTPLIKDCGNSSGSEESHGEESFDIQEVRNSQKSWPLVEVAALTENGCGRKLQEQFGIEFVRTEDSFILFEIQILNPFKVVFLVDIYAQGLRSSFQDAPDHVGMCYVYPENFKQTAGRFQSPITSMKYQPIGKLSVDYLMIKPITRIEMDFSFSYRNYWAEEWSGLDVGHRGLGNSYTKQQHCSNIKENTIASMRNAILHGADMVEFDVQVSRDLVPIVYHEFKLCVQTKTKNEEHIMLDVPVKDLTMSELQGLKSHHPSEKQDGVKSFGNEGDVEHESFPRLEDVLLNLDIACGFNIEIKYPQLMRDGNEETDQHPMEMNIFLDQVLTCILKHGQERLIVLSSFNPNVCSMLIHKQNKYPVLLLTMGKNTKYDQFMDPRTWSIPHGVWFVEMGGLLGLSVMAEALLNDPSRMDLVRSKNQVLFCWTDETNDPEIVKHLKTLGVNGVIYDRVDQNKEKFVTDGVFLADKKIIAKNSSEELSSNSSDDSRDNLLVQKKVQRKRSSLSFSGVIPSFI